MQNINQQVNNQLSNLKLSADESPNDFYQNH